MDEQVIGLCTVFVLRSVHRPVRSSVPSYRKRAEHVLRADIAIGVGGRQAIRAANKTYWRNSDWTSGKQSIVGLLELRMMIMGWIIGRFFQIKLYLMLLPYEWKVFHGGKEKLQKPEIKERWVPPEEGWVKANFDGAV